MGRPHWDFDRRQNESWPFSTGSDSVSRVEPRLGATSGPSVGISGARARNGPFLPNRGIHWRRRDSLLRTTRHRSQMRRLISVDFATRRAGVQKNELGHHRIQIRTKGPELGHYRIFACYGHALGMTKMKIGKVRDGSGRIGVLPN
jgi:hypothetical protein